MSDVFYRGYAIEDIDTDKEGVIHLWGYVPHGALIPKGDKVYVHKTKWRESFKDSEFFDENMPDYALEVVNVHQRAVRIFSPFANQYVRIYRDGEGHPLIDESGKGKSLMDRVWWELSR